ncbi:MAG: class I SAM-dependent methyltransferase [Candidatus Woesearchaeota archaeon]
MKQFDYGRFAQVYDLADGSIIPYASAVTALHPFLLPAGRKLLDAACGTGNFTGELKERGYDVEGFDLSAEMLSVARKKHPGVRFYVSDLRTPLKNRPDIVTCMFNAIGHLTPNEFQKVLDGWHGVKRIAFDIFNFEYLDKNFIDGEWIDTCKDFGETKLVRFNSNTLDRTKKIMHVNQRVYIQNKMKLTMQKDVWDMQVYTFKEIEAMLSKAGFRVLHKYGGYDEIEGILLFSKNSMFIGIVAESKG